MPLDTFFVQLLVDTARWQFLFGTNSPLSLILLPLEKLEQRQAVSCLASAELLHYARFTYPKRKLEWLGGRMAAKCAVMSAATAEIVDAVPQWSGLEVTAAPDGRPFVRIADNPDLVLPDISISHSHGLAVAMSVVHGRCGVDIQKVTESVIRVQKKFAAPAELDILQDLTGSGPKASQLTLLWAAKEALKKAVGTETLPGFLDVKLCRAAIEMDRELGTYFVFDLNLNDNTASRAGETFSVAVLFYKEHALAFTRITEQCMV